MNKYKKHLPNNGSQHTNEVRLFYINHKFNSGINKMITICMIGKLSTFSLAFQSKTILSPESLHHFQESLLNEAKRDEAKGNRRAAISMSTGFAEMEKSKAKYTRKVFVFLVPQRKKKQNY